MGYEWTPDDVVFETRLLFKLPPVGFEDEDDDEEE